MRSGAKVKGTTRGVGAVVEEEADTVEISVEEGEDRTRPTDRDGAYHTPGGDGPASVTAAGAAGRWF
jgi:hypothetical protein